MSYGKNGDTSASSDTPGKSTTSGFLPACDLAEAKARNVQTRTISDKQYPTTPGCRDVNADPQKIPGALVDGEKEPVRQPG